MIRAFRSEWSRILRLRPVIGGWGTMAGFALLFTLLLVGNAAEPDPGAPFEPGQGPTVPLALVEAPSGWVFSFQATGQLLGIVALVVAAGNLATEYTSGTLRALLVREPRRTVLLAGKASALAAFTLLGVAAALVVSVVATLGVAAVRGLDMSAWFTGQGWLAVGEAWLRVSAASVVWVLGGLVLAVLFRAGPPAIGIGVAYPILVEGLLGLVLPDVVRWMPGAVLNGLATGGVTEELGEIATLSTPTTVLLSATYALVFLGTSMLTLHVRDVG